MNFITGHMRQIIAIGAIGLSLPLIAQTEFESRPSDPSATSREHQTDMEKMVLKVSFKPEQGLVMGEVTHTFKPLRKRVDSLVLDAPRIRVSEVLLDGKKSLKYKSTTDHLICYFDQPLSWDERHEMKITYEANPRKGLYFIGWNSGDVNDPINQTRKQLWTQGQGIDNRHWIPMYDDMNDKFITETIITFDKTYNVLSNGVLKSAKENRDGTKTWHYAMSKPHAGYLLMLAIDRFAVKNTKTKTGVPVSFWYYPEHPERLQWTSLYTEKMIEFLESETGVAYPWESYSQVMVQDFMYGAMENTTATIFGDFFWVDSIAFNDRYYVGVNAHELTHQWFGDLITARSSADVWLQESWATYYAKMFEASVYGPDHLKWSQRQEVESALRASLKDNYPVRHSKGGTSRVYPKGSSVIQMLRYVLGDEAFKRVVRAYLEQYAYKNVETNDFYQVIQDELGLSLDWFFEQWLYRGGEPHYKVKYDLLENEVVLQVEQVHPIDQSIGHFKMPVKCRLQYREGGYDEGTFWVDGHFTEIRLPRKRDKSPAFVLFDLNSEITKKLEMQQQDEAWLLQFQQAEHMIDRYDALIALKKVNHASKKETYHNRYHEERFWAMKTEMLKQLKSLGDEEWVVQTLVNEDDIQVLRSFLLSENSTEGSWKGLWEKMLSAPSYQLREKALGLLCKAYPKEANTYLDQLRDQRGHMNNIRIQWLEIQLGINANETMHLNELIALSSPLYEFRTRTNAFDAMKRLGVYNEQTITHALDASISSNRRLASPANAYLQHFLQGSLNKELYLRVLNQLWPTGEKRTWLQESGLPLN